jgi:hypothetical protein
MAVGVELVCMEVDVMSGFSVPGLCYGQTYISSGGSTLLENADTWVQIDGATYNSGECCILNQTDSSSALRYMGRTPRIFVLNATISVSADVADNYQFAFAKNGVTIESSSVARQLNAGVEKGIVSLCWIVSMRNGNIISIVVKSDTQNNTTLTTDHASFVVNVV